MAVSPVYETLFEYEYALPLIQGEVQVPFENGVPVFARLQRSFVDRQLAPFALE